MEKVTWNGKNKKKEIKGNGKYLLLYILHYTHIITVIICMPHTEAKVQLNVMLLQLITVTVTAMAMLYL
jgi:hypothetical protein